MIAVTRCGSSVSDISDTANREPYFTVMSRASSIQFWSAVTCHRIGRLRLVATMAKRSPSKRQGVKPPQAKAVTGHRTPKMR
jgi:hypothetical protein